MINHDLLIEKATAAMKNAYAPYSGFFVGAALFCRDGEIYSGCNMENAAYPAGSCAEKAAFSRAITDGKREFKAICIVGGQNGVISDFCPPCGICRQVISEFAGENFTVILFDGKTVKEVLFSDLLPYSFGRDCLCE